jgi:hypothetical protein
LTNGTPRGPAASTRSEKSKSATSTTVSAHG